MYNKLKSLFALLGLTALTAVAVVYVLFLRGVLDADKVSNFLKFNPAVSGAVPAVSDTKIQTSFARLNAQKISLAALSSTFENGGGAIAELPSAELSGGMLVANKIGQFYLVDTKSSPPKLQELPARIDVNQAGYEAYAQSQGYAIRPGTNVGYAGLGMRLHDLLLTEDRKTLLASHTTWDNAKNCATLRVSLAAFSMNGTLPEIGAWKQIFESKPCLELSGQKNKPFAGHQAGGRMVQRGADKILLTIGDFKNDGVKRDISVADANVDYGKIFEIDISTSTSRVFSTGHRNPQGLTIAADGAIWATEHGPSGGDEVNVINDGANYGWPSVTLGKDCNGCDWQKEGRHDGYEMPVFSFVPSIGISNLVQSRNFVPNWEGDLLVASMVGQSLHHLRLDGRRVIYDEPIKIGDRLRDMIRLQDGSVALWTDSGQIITLTVDKEKSPSEVIAASLSPTAQSYVTQCGTCHALDAGTAPQGKIGLWGVAGRNRGGTSFAGYSQAMLSAGGVWTDENLDAYLKQPQAAVPGTSMAFEGIADQAVRNELVDFLRKLK
jgi:aldose sugar dehydrogenase